MPGTGKTPNLKRTHSRASNYPLEHCQARPQDLYLGFSFCQGIASTLHHISGGLLHKAGVAQTTGKRLNLVFDFAQIFFQLGLQRIHIHHSGKGNENLNRTNHPGKHLRLGDRFSGLG